MTSPRDVGVVGLRASLSTLVKLAREAGIDPKRIRPALRAVERDGQTWRVRCWVLVDDVGVPSSTADVGLKKSGRQPAAFKLVTGPLQHRYELE